MHTKSLFILLTAVLIGACGNGPTADTPPSHPTHHVIVRGMVTDTLGNPLAGLGVAGLTADEFAGPSASGGGQTDSLGRYEFEVTTSSETKTADQTIWIRAQKRGPPRLVQKMLLLFPIDFAPLDVAPEVVEVPTIRLPLP